jgi:DegV family protein with EDD domain
VNNARQAARMLLGRCEIVVLDSQTVSLGLGILVEAAVCASRQDKSFEEIVRIVRGLIPRIYIVFFSENLEYLRRGGRIGEAQALLGTMLGIKPFLTLEEGEIQPMEKVRTREEALEKVSDFVAEFDAVEQLAIIRGMHERSSEIEFLLEQLHDLFPELEVPIIHYGPVLASHIGPDNLGVIVYESLEFEE